MRLSERIPDPNIWRVYRTTLALGIAYGIAIATLSVFLDERGFSKQDIGSLAAYFAAGIVAFSVPVGALIRRWSARTVLAVSLLGYSITVSVFPFLTSYPSLAAVRFLDGACSVGIWVSCETILLARSAPGTKAFVTSLYAIAISIGYVAGPIAARALVSLAPLSAVFLAAGSIALGASLYVWWRLDADPRLDHASTPASSSNSASLQLASYASTPLLRRIKTSCFATFAYGYFQASVVLFLPLYLMAEKHVARDRTILIPAFFALGMLLFSSYAGRAGDRFGHLLVMRLLALVGTATVLGFVFLDAYPLMCLAVAVAGASLASISPVSLALQGVVCAPREYSRATSYYNGFYAAGMLLGPPISSYIFSTYDGGLMLYHLALLWAAFALFAFVFQRDDPAARVVPERVVA